MTQEQKNHIQQLAKEHFRYSFSHIKAKADSKGAHLEAYYLFLVDDFFAVSDAAISREAIKAYDPNATILDAIWSGECEEDYNGSYVPVQKKYRQLARQPKSFVQRDLSLGTGFRW